MLAGEPVTGSNRSVRIAADRPASGRRSRRISLLALVTAIILSAVCLTACTRTPANEPVPTQDDASGLQSYLAAVSNRLREHRFLIKPFYGAATESAVQVAIILDAKGMALNYGLRSSSGNADVDRMILAMVARASPFPRPPADLLKSDQLGIGIAITLPKSRKEWGEAFD